jgi:hypothetical protein
MMRVVICGDGVAAYCCAHLLSKAGFSVDLEPVNRSRLPVILLGDQALALIRDVFDEPDLFKAAPRVCKRTVAWGLDSQPRTLEHSAVAVSEEVLLESVRPKLAENPDHADARWTILAARPLPGPAVEHPFGSRMATVATVELRVEADSSACAIESLEDGWLFLIPNAPRSGWLLATGGPLESLLSRSQVVARVISSHSAPSGEFPAYPRIVSPLGGPNWLACGTAAMAFDPICGDGTAHAIREAVLASAVIRAVANAGDTGDLLGHYEARLTAGFHRHLTLCREFYQSGGTGAFWASELAAIDDGVQWSDRKLGEHPSFRYQLRGFELEAVR